jgi:pSer/pThr/pTyr-binding forkhead associated (FHA) protein
MKLSLVVVTAGKMQGKSIPITLPEFVIGRDPECHLRPASPLISKRHCAFLMQGNKASVRDFGSTNGTLVNNEVVEGEHEIVNGDIVKVGPIEFRVELEVTAPLRQTPMPRSMPSEAEDTAAALFLSLGDDDSTTGNSNVDGQGVPTGSTIMEAINLPPENAPPGDPNAQTPADEKASKDRMTAAKALAANTSTAAKAILEKYMRRPRGG